MEAPRRGAQPTNVAGIEGREATEKGARTAMFRANGRQPSEWQRPANTRPRVSWNAISNLVSPRVERELSPEKLVMKEPRQIQDQPRSAKLPGKATTIGEESPSSRQVNKRTPTSKPTSFVEVVKRVEEDQAGKASLFQLSGIKDDNFLEEWETLDLLLLEKRGFCLTITR